MPGFLGIDIAKAKFDAALLLSDSKRCRTFDNDESGFTALLGWIGGDLDEVHACLEATGGYGDDLALFLHEHAIKVSVVNPLQIKAFGQAELLRTKTDKTDAALIARFCRSQQPAPWAPPSPKARELRALVRRCSNLKQMRVMELQRKAQGSASETVAASVNGALSWLDNEIARIGDAIAQIIKSDAYLEKAAELLLSIPGLGMQSIAVILAEIPDFRLFAHNKQISAFAGLAPQDHQSGKSVRGKAHISKIGSGRLRAMLYLCALSARRYNPSLKEFADRLKQNGKAPKVILVAVARKLLVIAYGVIKAGRPFEPA